MLRRRGFSALRLPRLEAYSHLGGLHPRLLLEKIAKRHRLDNPVRRLRILIHFLDPFLQLRQRLFHLFGREARGPRSRHILARRRRDPFVMVRSDVALHLDHRQDFRRLRRADLERRGKLLLRPARSSLGASQEAEHRFDRHRRKCRRPRAGIFRTLLGCFVCFFHRLGAIPRIAAYLESAATKSRTSSFTRTGFSCTTQWVASGILSTFSFGTYRSSPSRLPVKRYGSFSPQITSTGIFTSNDATGCFILNASLPPL